MFKKWTVMEKENGERHYFYGPLSDFDKDDLDGFVKIVPYCKLNCNDLVVLFENELEDKNYHNFTNLGEQILNALNSETKLSESEKAAVMKCFMKDFMQYHNMT